MTTTPPNETRIDTEKAIKELRWLAAAVCRDSTRTSITRIQADEKRAVATDGHRLHFIEDSCFPAGFALSTEAIETIMSLAKPGARMRFSTVTENGICIARCIFESSRSNIEATFRTPTDSFPAYERVVPCETDGAPTKTEALKTAFSPDDSTRLDIGPGRFNSTYIADALRGAPTEVVLYVGADKDSPLLFRYGARGAVVMPLRK